MADMNCLNNEDELVSQLDSQSQIDSELDSVAELSGDMENVVEVAPNFTGLATEDIVVSVDNNNKTISAELTDTALSNYVTLDTDQKITGNKAFDKIQLDTEQPVPVYEQEERTVVYEYNFENIPSDNQYGFISNDGVRYEATNIGVGQTYAMCKISFNMHKQQDLLFGFSHTGNYEDYFVFSVLDTELTTSLDVYEDYNQGSYFIHSEGYTDGKQYTLTYTAVPEGEHFITVKLIKLSDTAVENESAKLWVKSPIGEVVEVFDVIVGYENFSALVKVDNDLDLTYNGDKLITPTNAEVELRLAENFATKQELISTHELINSVNDGLSIYINDVQNSLISTDANLQSQIDNNSFRISGNTIRVDNLENSLNSLAPVAYTGDYNDLVVKAPEASETVSGTIKAWVNADGYLCISTDGEAVDSPDGISRIFSENSVETIASVSQTISEQGYNSALVSELYGWNLGDSIPITLSSGETIEMQIIGINHDDKSDGSGKAGITLQMVNCLAERYTFDSDGNTEGGYITSRVRNEILPTIMHSIPPDWLSVIKPVNKASNNGAGTQLTGMNYTSESVFLVSASEVMGASSDSYISPEEGEQYEYWAQTGIRTKYYDSDHDLVPDKSVAWWTRTCDPASINRVVNVATTGRLTSSGTTASRGISFAFCV